MFGFYCLGLGLASHPSSESLKLLLTSNCGSVALAQSRSCARTCCAARSIVMILFSCEAGPAPRSKSVGSNATAIAWKATVVFRSR